MTKQKARELFLNINLNTIIGTVAGGLILAVVIGVATRIEKLQIDVAKMNVAIEELQRSANRINTPK